MLSSSKWFALNKKEVDGTTKWGIEIPKDYKGTRDVVSEDIMIPFIYDSIEVVKADMENESDWCINDIFVGIRLDEDGNPLYDAYKPWVSGGPPVGFYHFGFNCLKESLSEYPTHESVVSKGR